MTLFGKLGYDALPFYSAVAAIGAAFTVLGFLAVVAFITWKRGWTFLWQEWLTSLDHKKIGVMYVVLALVMLARGFVDALMMRAQQAMAFQSQGYLEPEHFHQIFSSHGTLMIFFVAMPFIAGLINFVMPLQIGARDVAFPKLNSLSFWLTAAGGWLVMISLVIGRFSTGGWSGYPPVTELAYNPGVGVDYWIFALLISGIGSTLTGVNFLTTIWKCRAPGMKLMHMPLFCWTALCTAILMIFALPPLTVATALLALDRYLDFHFFTNDAGGNVMNYANLFWLFGHPEVYILILPAFGIYSEVISTFSRKKLFGYTSLVYATMAIAVLSFTVWLHHFFTMGGSADVNAAFGIATMVIAVPTGVKVFDWLFTMWRGRIEFTVPMKYAIAFIASFTLGGVTGVLHAIPPFDYLVHNSTFLVAHFHNMLIPGTLFGMFAGYTFWFPKAFGFRLDERWGNRAFWCWLVGFYLAFMPLYALGLMSMPRRLAHYDIAAWHPWLIVAALGAAVLALGFLFMVVQLGVSIRDRKRLRDLTGDPWNARSMEWSLASPPPEYNYATIPVIDRRDMFWEMKKRGLTNAAAPHSAAIELPKPSALGPVLGGSAALLGFAVIWHIWWAAIAISAFMIAFLVRASFVDPRTLHEIVPANGESYLAL